ncbi:MAG: tyrosine--tRNA ligase [bacterium]|nr:tyrosine--tRNA ligase [bacterium]
MSKIIVDEKKINEFLTRGVEAIYPTTDALRKKLMSGERLRVYQGFDPTGPYLHVGHAIGIRASRILQELGHEIIFLVGDFTAKIGDPDKDTTRKILTDEQIKKNMAGWKEQAGQLIDFDGENPVRFEQNYKWLSELKLNDLIKLMSQMTVAQMLARDLFKKRVKENKDIHLQELIYPLMQGYDSVAMKVDIEIGGTDQIFNMLVGRDLCKSYLNKEKFIRANKMMDAPDGITMSKTKGNGINLGDSAEDMYGKAMSYQDSAILSGLELLTDVSMDIIKNIGKSLENGENPMLYKKRMAFEIVKTIKGIKDAQKAQKHFEDTVQKKEIPDSIINYKLSIANWKLIDLLVEIKLAESKSEARRLVEQGGVKVDSEVVKDINKEIKIIKEGVLIQKGKRGFVKVMG